MKVDILAIAAHPDDVELGCAGTIASEIAKGKSVAIVDFTMGELGTRGSAELRMQEAENAKSILGISYRENLGFRDGFFQNDEAHQLEVIRVIRKYQPKIILGNAPHDRHPDHGKAHELIRDAAFLSGLQKIVTYENGSEQKAHRPAHVFSYIQARYIEPDFCYDISGFWDIKQKAIMAFSSQFFSKDSKEPETFISTPEFMKFIEARCREFGQSIQAQHAEGFLIQGRLGVKDLSHIF